MPYRYIETFEAGFADLTDVQLSFMQSDGGLAPTNRFSGHRAVLSGPAGGYVGYALTTKWQGYNPKKLQLIGFDMGGTSTDVSRFAGSYEHVFEATLAGQALSNTCSQHCMRFLLDKKDATHAQGQPTILLRHHPLCAMPKDTAAVVML